MRINKKKPKGKYQVKKFPHGGTHSEGELPEEGTMMGDLLRMLEGFKPEYEYEFVPEQDASQNISAIRMFGSDDQKQVLDYLLNDPYYTDDDFTLLQYAARDSHKEESKKRGEGLLQMANDPGIRYGGGEEERNQKKIEATLYNFYNTLTDEQKKQVDESTTKTNWDPKKGKVIVPGEDYDLEKYSGEATNPMEDAGFRKFVKTYGPVTGEAPFKEADNYYDFTYSPAVTRTGTEGEFTKEGFGYSRTIQTITDQIERGRKEDGSLSKGDLMNAEQLGLDKNATSEEIAKAIANYKLNRSASIDSRNVEFLNQNSPTYTTFPKSPIRGSILGKYKDNRITLSNLNTQLPTVYTHEKSHLQDDFIKDYKLLNEYGLSHYDHDFDDFEHRNSYNYLYTDASRELINNLRKDFKKKNPNHPSFRGRGSGKLRYNYISSITETMARVNEIRSKLGIYDRDFTLKDLDKFPKIKGTQLNALGQLRQVYTDEGIVEMMNKVYKKGGFIPKKKKQGGKITLLKK